MKRIRHDYIVILLCILIAVCSTACSHELPALQNIAEGQSTTPESIEIVISHSQALDTPEDIAARAMQTKLQELLGEAADVIVYADYQLGSAEEQLEALQLGRVHITIQSVSHVSKYADDLKVLTLPYLFPQDTQAVIELLDGAMGQEVLDRVDMECGEPAFKGLGLWFGGYKLFTFHGEQYKHIQSPADFRGLHIAVPDASLVKAQYRHWGVEPVPADSVALYSILAQQIADGSEATLAQIATNYLHEVQHNIVQAHHSAEVYTVLANAQWFSALPDDTQQAVLEAEAYGRKMMYRALAEKEPVYREQICQTEGMRFEVLNEKEIQIFKAATWPIYTEQLAGSPWQTDYVARIQKCFT